MEWATFFSTILGAGVSIVTSLVVFGFTSWSETKKAEAIQKRKSAFLAFNGFQKLMQISNDLANNSLYIDNAFKDADEQGLGDLDPFQKLQPLVRARVPLEPLTIDEMYFLVESKNSEVLAEIDLIYRRALNVEAVIDQFNAMKTDFYSFIEAKDGSIEPGEGTLAKAKLAGADAKLSRLKGGAMNNLIGQLLEYLERDCVESKRVAEFFLTACQKHFGKDFPQVKLTWEF